MFSAHKGSWGPEFRPSVEEIMKYPMISLRHFSQFAFSSELAFMVGDFPIQSTTWKVKVNRLKPRAPILYTYTEHAQFVNVS